MEKANEITKNEFVTLLHLAGFKNKKEFARFVNLPYASVNNWGSGSSYPSYLKTLMTALVNSKKYRDLVNGNSLIAENESLKQENTLLKQKLETIKGEKQREQEKLEILMKSLSLIKEYQNIT